MLYKCIVFGTVPKFVIYERVNGKKILKFYDFLTDYHRKDFDWFRYCVQEVQQPPVPYDWFTDVSSISSDVFEENINPFPNKPLLSQGLSTSPLKTLWEKEKLLIMREYSAIFIKLKIVVCNLFEFGRV